MAPCPFMRKRVICRAAALRIDAGSTSEASLMAERVSLACENAIKHAARMIKATRAGLIVAAGLVDRGR